MGWEVLIRGEWVVSVRGATVARKESMKACGKMAEMLQTKGHRVQEGVVENCGTLSATGSQAWHK